MWHLLPSHFYGLFLLLTVDVRTCYKISKTNKKTRRSFLLLLLEDADTASSSLSSFLRSLSTFVFLLQVRIPPPPLLHLLDRVVRFSRVNSIVLLFCWNRVKRRISQLSPRAAAAANQIRKWGKHFVIRRRRPSSPRSRASRYHYTID